MLCTYKRHDTISDSFCFDKNSGNLKRLQKQSFSKSIINFIASSAHKYYLVADHLKNFGGWNLRRIEEQWKQCSVKWKRYRFLRRCIWTKKKIKTAEVISPSKAHRSWKLYGTCQSRTTERSLKTFVISVFDHKFQFEWTEKLETKKEGKNEASKGTKVRTTKQPNKWYKQRGVKN